jgi:hypothetical protein
MRRRASSERADKRAFRSEGFERTRIAYTVRQALPGAIEFNFRGSRPLVVCTMSGQKADNNKYLTLSGW